MNPLKKALCLLVGLVWLPAAAGWSADPAASAPAKKPAPAAAKPAPQPAPAAEAAAEPSLFDSLWLKVRAVVSSEEEEVAQGPKYSAVAGLRGARSQDQSLKPIWKGKETKAAKPAVSPFEQAKDDYAAGRFEAAVEKLRAAETAGPLAPEAQVLLGLAYARQEKKAEARTVFEAFLAANPNHELAAEVKPLLEKLQEPPAP